MGSSTTWQSLPSKIIVARSAIGRGGFVMAKEFAVTVYDGACINCGICMDVCPIRTLDMTRDHGPGPEATFLRATPGRGATHDWMMVAPVPADHCNG